MTPDGISDDFEISAGVLKGDTLAPFILFIVVDWVMRNATDKLEKVLDFLWRRILAGLFTLRIDVQQNSQTDLDFADNIALLLDNMADVQRLLLAVEHWALGGWTENQQEKN